MNFHEFDDYADAFQPVRSRSRGKGAQRGKKPKLDDFAEYAERYGELDQTVAELDAPEYGDRWSTWDQSSPETRGPRPYPNWIITELGAVDTELGVLKTGKEADVFLLERSIPAGRAILMAAKRYRDTQHRMFHRDDGYREGRRTKDSRVNRAVSKGTAFGREAVAGQWANAEFTALSQLWAAGIAVPYPVQIVGIELLMEYIGSDDGGAAPRLAQLRPSPAERDDLWDQLRQNLSLFARSGYAHGDLSAYNVLVHDGRLVIIDVPQIVDLIANPHGAEFLTRDVRNVGAWFAARGLPESRVDELVDDLIADAGIA